MEKSKRVECVSSTFTFEDILGMDASVNEEISYAGCDSERDIKRSVPDTSNGPGLNDCM